MEHVPAERAAELSQRKADEALQRVGEWLSRPPMGERLGIVARKRAWGAMAGGVALGVAVGATLAMMVHRRRAQPTPGPDASWEQEQGIAPPLGYGQVDLTDPREAATTTM
jgi:hypothetical protein